MLRMWPDETRLAGSMRRSCTGGGKSSRVQPRRQEFYQNPQNTEGKKHKYDRGEQSFAGGEAHLISGVAEETFGEELAADDDIPAHGEDADNSEASGDGIDALAHGLGELQDLCQAQEADGRDRAEQDLDDHLRGPETSVHHEIEAAERFVGFVDALDEVEHLEAEIDDECVEQILRDGVEAANVDWLSAQAVGKHVEQHHGGDARDHGGKDENDGHQRRRPPGLGFDGAEDEADISVEQEGGRNADQGDEIAEAFVDGERTFAHVIGAEGEHAIDDSRQSRGALRFQNNVAAVVEPDFQQQHRHQIPEIDEAEHGHGGGAVRREIHFERAFGMTEMQLQRERRDQQKREGGEQRQAVGGFDGLHAEDALE